MANDPKSAPQISSDSPMLVLVWLLLQVFLLLVVETVSLLMLTISQ